MEHKKSLQSNQDMLIRKDNLYIYIYIIMYFIEIGVLYINIYCD